VLSWLREMLIKAKRYSDLKIKRCCSMPTVTVNKSNYKRLLDLAGKLQIKKKEKISINDVITGLLNITEKTILEECLR
jgi:hypothetical protein